MPCTRPVYGWRSAVRNDKGKRPIVFKRDQALVDQPVTLPCGRCIGCRLEKSRQWAVRIMHEASMHDDNCFVTLTYNDDNLPADNSLHLPHFQKFMKRLRKKHGKLRFFHCGEYGDNFDRPHYHACLFGFTPSDAVPWKTLNGNRLYSSDLLSSTWGHGFVSLGALTFESAAYVARYVTKKLTGPESLKYGDRTPPYSTQSRRPGIGVPWLEQWYKDIYPRDYVVMRGHQMKVPRAYDRYFETVTDQSLDDFKRSRTRKAKDFIDPSDQTERRLHDRETVLKAKLSQSSRTFDKETST